MHLFKKTSGFLIWVICPPLPLWTQGWLAGQGQLQSWLLWEEELTELPPALKGSSKFSPFAQKWTEVEERKNRNRNGGLDCFYSELKRLEYLVTFNGSNTKYWETTEGEVWPEGQMIARGGYRLSSGLPPLLLAATGSLAPLTFSLCKENHVCWHCLSAHSDG